GLGEWFGPARHTEAFAIAMRFRDDDDFVRHAARLFEALGHHHPLTAIDWTRIVLATELAFASDVVGSGLDWQTTTGISDEDAVRLLRSVQRKVVRMTSTVVHETLGARLPRTMGQAPTQD